MHFLISICKINLVIDTHLYMQKYFVIAHLRSIQLTQWIIIKHKVKKVDKVNLVATFFIWKDYRFILLWYKIFSLLLWQNFFIIQLSTIAHRHCQGIQSSFEKYSVNPFQINFASLVELFAFVKNNDFHALHKKWSFPLRISSVNVTKSAVTEEILNGKLRFLCSDD